MSISSEISRISQNVADSLDAVAMKGVIVPAGSTSDDLPGLIAQITAGGGGGIVITDIADSHGGTIRTITATEISGTKMITQNGMEDVTSYAAVNVQVPTGGSTLVSKTIIANGTYDPADDGADGYSEVTVNVPATAPNLQAKTNVSPTESSQTVTADSGYDGLSSVQINAVSSSYVGSGIARRSGTDLTASGATVTVPAGYYASQATKSVSSGTVTAPSTISGTSATVSTGTNTLTLTKTVSVTPNVSTAGYISSGTAGNSSVSLTASVTTKSAATITPTKSAQTIASGTYLTGTQTIAAIPAAYQDVTGVTAAAGDVVSGKSIVSSTGATVNGTLVIQHYYTGSSAPASSLGVNGDIYLQT